MDESRLFRLAVESGAIVFRHVPAVGWSITLTYRRGDETWIEAKTEHYEGLSTSELLDVMYAATDSVL